MIVSPADSTINFHIQKIRPINPDFSDLSAVISSRRRIFLLRLSGELGCSIMSELSVTMSIDERYPMSIQPPMIVTRIVISEMAPKNGAVPVNAVIPS